MDVTANFFCRWNDEFGCDPGINLDTKTLFTIDSFVGKTSKKSTNSASSRPSTAVSTPGSNDSDSDTRHQLDSDKKYAEIREKLDDYMKTHVTKCNNLRIELSKEELIVNYLQDLISTLQHANSTRENRDDESRVDASPIRRSPYLWEQGSNSDDSPLEGRERSSSAGQINPRGSGRGNMIRGRPLVSSIPPSQRLKMKPTDQPQNDEETSEKKSLQADSPLNKSVESLHIDDIYEAVEEPAVVKPHKKKLCSSVSSPPSTPTETRPKPLHSKGMRRVIDAFSKKSNKDPVPASGSQTKEGIGEIKKIKSLTEEFKSRYTYTTTDTGEIQLTKKSEKPPPIMKKPSKKELAKLASVSLPQENKVSPSKNDNKSGKKSMYGSQKSPPKTTFFVDDEQSLEEKSHGGRAYTYEDIDLIDEEDDLPPPPPPPSLDTFPPPPSKEPPSAPASVSDQIYDNNNEEPTYEDLSLDDDNQLGVFDDDRKPYQSFYDGGDQTSDSDDPIEDAYKLLASTSCRTWDAVDPSSLYADPEVVRKQKHEKFQKRSVHNRLSVDFSNPDETAEIVENVGRTPSIESDPIYAECGNDLYEQLPCKQADFSYLRHKILQEIAEKQDQFLVPINIVSKIRNNISLLASGENKPIMTEEEMTTVFFRIDDIYESHSHFQTKLNERLKNWNSETLVGDLIKEMVVYEVETCSEYFKNFNEAVEIVRKICDENKEFKALAQGIRFSKCQNQDGEPLQEILRKPLLHIQTHSLQFEDLLRVTPGDHDDQHYLKQAVKLMHEFLATVDVQPSLGKIQGGRILCKNKLVVEIVNNERKLRHLFLFNDILICAKPKTDRFRQKVAYDCKWQIPINDTIDVGDSLKVQVDEDSEDKNKAELKNLKKKIKQNQMDLKQEQEKNTDSKEKPWSLVSREERLRKKLLETLSQYVIRAPKLNFEIRERSGKVHLLKMASDYEREEWRSAIKSVQEKSKLLPGSPRNLSGIEVMELFNSCQQIHRFNDLGGMLLQDVKEDEIVNGMLNVTIHRLEGLQKPADIFCCMEVDSYGQFSLQAKTNLVVGSKGPCWDNDFEIQLDGSQTLRILCYQKTSEDDILLGRYAMELNYKWLKSIKNNFKNKMVQLEGKNSLIMEISVKYNTTSQTIKRKPNKIGTGLFGCKLSSLAIRENCTIPFIVIVCTKEVEKRGYNELGIYRVSGVTSKVQELVDKFTRDSKTNHVQDPDIHDVTGLLKRYFRELPEALFTDRLFTNFAHGLQMAEPEAKETCMISLFKELPEPNYSLALHMLEHLVRISRHSDVNKMTLPNLATVFGPTLLRPAATSSVVEMNISEQLAMSTREAMNQTGILLYFLELLASGKNFQREPFQENLI